MKRLIIFLAAGGFFTCIFAQKVFRTNIAGMAVQSFAGTETIDGFTVSGPDAEGYVYLTAHAGSESGEVLRTRWQGCGFQEFLPPEGEHVTGFLTAGPDESGRVYLVASASNGDTASIIMTGWQGSGVQEYSFGPGEEIKAINASSPGDGYVYLSVGSEGLEEDPPPSWLEPPVFSLGDIPNPCRSLVRISYSVAVPGNVTIRIYDSSGRLIKELLGDERAAGSHELIWPVDDNDGRKVGTGVYFVRMTAGSFSACKKITIL